MKKKKWKRGPHTKTILKEIRDFFEGRFGMDIKHIPEDDMEKFCPMVHSILHDIPCQKLCGKVWPQLAVDYKAYHHKKKCHCPCHYFTHSRKELLKKLKEFKLL